jgi:hypothetical protein
VRSRAVVARHRSSSAAVRAEPVVATPITAIGPYEVTGALASAPHVLSGVDAALRRPVWIVRHSIGTAPLDERERQAIRSGTARWIGGRRTEHDAWDAYASTTGVALRERLAHPFEWRELQAWLSDLVDELIARTEDRDATLPTSIDRILISEEGHAIVVPFVFDASGTPIGHAGTNESPPPTTASTPTLLRELAAQVMQQTNPATAAADPRITSRASWPLSATTLLAQLAAGSISLDATKDALRRVVERTEPMTARRRATLWAAGVIPLVAFALFSALMSNLLDRTNTDVARMQPLLTFIRDTTSTADSIVRQKQLVAVYVVANFRQRIVAQRTVTDTVLGSAANGFISRREWALADSLERAMPTMAPVDVQAATRLVDDTWGGRPPKAWRQLTLVPVMLAVSFSAFAAIMAFGAALLVRRGMLMRLLGLELVDARGERASRGRLLWRQVLVWMPIAGVVSAPLMMIREKPSPALLALLIVSTVALLASLLTAWRNPSRGLAERLSGTTMVPE